MARREEIHLEEHEEKGRVSEVRVKKKTQSEKRKEKKKSVGLVWRNMKEKDRVSGFM